jgi:hypothetical protein
MGGKEGGLYWINLHISRMIEMERWNDRKAGTTGMTGTTRMLVMLAAVLVEH